MILLPIVYTSQYALSPRILERDVTIASSWYIPQVNFIPYTLELFGYNLFGIAALLLTAGFMTRRGLWS